MINNKTTLIRYFTLFLLFFFLIAIAHAQTNNAPIATKDVATVDQDTTLNVPSGAPDNYANLLDNDSDDDGDALSITRFSVNGGITWVNANSTANIPGIGAITINDDGTYTFVPVAGYSGLVPNIIYEVSDGTDTSMAILYLTVETSGDLIEISNISSCNQGYTADGQYKIRYQVSIHNKSITRGYHQNSEISNIQLFDDLNAVFGDCITQIDRTPIEANAPDNFLGGNYDVPNISFDAAEFDATDPTPGADGLFLNFADILYPNQSIFLQFCVYIDPFCNGRPNPTPSGSGINFDNIISVTSNKGNVTDHLLLEDFHTPETTVAANLFIPNQSPLVNFDGTYDYTNSVIITNDGTAQANNVNFNLGLKRFTDNGIVFSMGDHDNDPATPDVQTPFVYQVDASGTPISTVVVNTAYDGINSPKILASNQNLAAGETIYFKVFHHINSIISTANNQFFNPNVSMTQGPLDGLDETINDSEKTNSFVIWSDSQGDHLDRYYLGSNSSDISSSNNQCDCAFLDMQFVFTMQLNIEKTLADYSQASDNILEHKLVVFNIKVENLSTSSVRAENLVLEDNLLGICGGNILNVNGVEIQLPTATENIPEEVPNLNLSYDGTTDLKLFDETSGILNPGEFLNVLITIIVEDDCFGVNTASFNGLDPLLNPVSIVISGVNVSVFSDSDNDGITNLNDLDDDNDGIPDLDEYGGLNPLDDDDNDNIPNYEDTDYGVDSNNDGIVDLFDFDMDGVPNHFDLDSDNDGIFDIVEAGNGNLDTNSNGTTNSPVGINGLDDTLETTDDLLAVINYVIVNSDTDSNYNFIDIDSDNDGIVDNIEAQLTDSYVVPNVPDTNGSVYISGLTPIDTDGDTIPDYLDTDSDNDLRDDIIEAWDTNNDGVPETNISNTDTDNDGLDNAYDNNNLLADSTNSGQLPTDFPNVDNDFTTERDWRELPAILLIVNPDDTVVEGNDLVFILKLVALNDHTILKTSATDVTFNVYTSDGTDTTNTYDVAASPFDYIGIASTLPDNIIIPAGNSEITIAITTNDDTIDELDELMTFNVITTSDNTINPDTNLLESDIELKAIGTIQDNDNAPDLIMNDDIKPEGDDLVHTIQIDNTTNPTTSSSRPIEIEITVTDGTAISPDDYLNTSPTTVIIPATDDPANENVSVDYNIETLIDNLNEPLNENIFVVGVITSGDVSATDLNKKGVIVDVDPDPTVTVSNPTIVEGGLLEFEISLSSLNFDDVIMNVFSLNGTASEPLDYIAFSEQVTIAENTLSTIVQITTIDDKLVEDLEDLTLKSIVTTSNTDNIEAEGIGTIIDNEFPNLFSPNNDGLSDVFEIISLKQYPKFKLQIFDRWGSLVYDYENKSNPTPVWWDGTIKGNPVPEGVYYYTIDYNDGSTIPKSGFIQLIR